MANKSTIKIESAQAFAQKKHSGQIKKDGVTPVIEHLEGVVSRLKGLGVNDEDVLCAGWLHDVIEDTDTSFDEILNLFGKKTALLVLSLTKDKALPRKKRDSQYIKQLKAAPLEAKLIKLCDISSNLKDIDKSDLKPSKKKKTIQQIIHYYHAILGQILESQPDNAQLQNLIDGINAVKGHVML